MFRYMCILLALLPKGNKYKCRIWGPRSGGYEED
jgi:hypothetical protein